MANPDDSERMQHEPAAEQVPQQQQQQQQQHNKAWDMNYLEAAIFLEVCIFSFEFKLSSQHILYVY